MWITCRPRSGGKETEIDGGSIRPTSGGEVWILDLHSKRITLEPSITKKSNRAVPCYYQEARTEDAFWGR